MKIYNPYDRSTSYPGNVESTPIHRGVPGNVNTEDYINSLKNGGYTRGEPFVGENGGIEDYINSLRNGGYTRGVRGTFYDEDGNEISPYDALNDRGAADDSAGNDDGGYTRGVPGNGNIEDYIAFLQNGGYTRGVRGTFYDEDGNEISPYDALNDRGAADDSAGNGDDRAANEPGGNEDDRAANEPAGNGDDRAANEPAGNEHDGYTQGVNGGGNIADYIASLKNGGYTRGVAPHDKDGNEISPYDLLNDRATNEPAGNENGGYTQGVNGDSNIADYIASLKNGGYTRGVRGTFYDEDGNEISPNDLFGDHAADEPGRGEIPHLDSTPMPTQEIDNGTAHLPIA
ncbi:hypothetical protein [Nitratireductor sp. GCM10026969]|uniref:hypothetical protein n=1 Tax=Nitratireductor sp. GCM10026969 TaxID=3252645 RepID=UPI00361EB49D